MLATPRTYQQLQILELEARKTGDHQVLPATGWRASPTSLRHAGEMLLAHQVGMVRVGEVVRYTLTYSPSLDRILPAPTHLHVKVKNTSAIPLRAAYLHGPYTLYAACYPSTFDPNHKDDALQQGSPDFEPNLKAGGSWISRLTVPEKNRVTAGKANVKRTADGGVPDCTWIIEVSSQVIFSTSATVHFELLIGRDENSIDLGFTGLKAQNIAMPGQLEDHQQEKRRHGGHGAGQQKGVFSKAVKLQVDDTKSLWNKPALPLWADDGGETGMKGEGSFSKDDSSSATLRKVETHAETYNADNEPPKKKQKRIHLVVLTHGLHSNLGSDMLYLKESIDAAAKKARESARKRKSDQKSMDHSGVRKHKGDEEVKDGDSSEAAGESSTASLSGGQEELDSALEDNSEDEEEVIVRGFSGNAVRTERGIQYLGKRLAKHVLEITYPDQPFLPVKKSVKKRFSQVFTGQQLSNEQIGLPAHTHSSIHREIKIATRPAYKITSISFIAHSLGGLTQTYAIAYIQKHAPQFFKDIRPINFVTMASPFLGLSNENPLYVKFALDFGLVGRTGQDLGLSWRAPAMVRSRWGAMIGGIGSEGQRALRQPDPRSKPLLRILPTGPAHQVLKLFRNRTVYSNVVNDGIVPLRTSCLLFLDWSGLGRVEKARRENGIVGTMAGWGWAELTGANSSSHRHLREIQDDEVQSQASQSSMEGPRVSGKEAEQKIVPQPTKNAVKDDNSTTEIETPEEHQFLEGHRPENEDSDSSKRKDPSPAQLANPLSGLLNFLRPAPSKPRNRSTKHAKIYKRSQTLKPDTGDGASVSSGSTSGLDNSLPPSRPEAVRGDSIADDPDNIFTPPKTSIFESAGDILNPPLPSREFIINPASRPRTIFHDRVYHPEDIPPPLVKKRKALSRSFSSESKNAPLRSDTDYNNGKDPTTASGMKVEEKIARAYHHDVSWRKVLVRLEPDAHNNICVRRMFSNAYGWPVIKHLVDTHFSDSFAATTADEKEPNQERAKPMSEAVGEHGEEVYTAPPHIDISRTDSELREAKEEISDLTSLQDSSMTSASSRPQATRADSAQWDDALFYGTDDDSESEDADHQRRTSADDSNVDDDGVDDAKGTTDAEIADFLSSPSPEDAGSIQAKDVHRSNTTVNSEKPLVIRGGTTSVGLGKSVHTQLAGVGRIRKDADEAEGGSKRENEHSNVHEPSDNISDPLAGLL